MNVSTTDTAANELAATADALVATAIGDAMPSSRLGKEEEEVVEPETRIPSGLSVSGNEYDSTSCPGTAKTLNELIGSSSNLSISANASGFKSIVDMNGFENHEISMDVEGRQLIVSL